MKLAELKEKFKHKYCIRVAAGVLTIAVVAGAACHTVYGAKTMERNEPATELSAKTAASKKQTAEKEGRTAKEETVYIFADQNGTAKKTIVSEWLKNPQKQSVLKDCSELKEIENVKGNETVEQKGSHLSWMADGKDIYYQGTTAKEAPITEKITYYLDGREIAADDLAGKSGSVKIRFDYVNHETRGDVCVPFAVLSGMALNDHFSNVEVTNGKEISNGDRKIVVGMAFPGWKESLAIGESDLAEDISIPDYVEVTADVEDFSLDMTMTVVMGASEFASDLSFDFDELDQNVEDLEEASHQLRDGSGELADGLKTMQQKMGEFSNGSGALQNGIAAYTDGAQKLANGIETFKGQTGLLISGVADLAESVGTLNNGVKTLDQSLRTAMGEKEKAAAMAQAKASAEAAAEAQFADDANPQSYQNIKSQAEQQFYAAVASDEVRQAAASAAKQAAAVKIQEQKTTIAAQAKEQAVAAVREQKAAIAAQAKEQAQTAIGSQVDDIAAQAKDQAIAAASSAMPADVKEQLRAAFVAAGYVRAAQTGGMTVEEAMGSAEIQASVTQAAEAQLQSLTATVGTAAGTAAEETAKRVASAVAGSVAEQVAPTVAEQAAGTAVEQAAGSVAEQVAKSVAEQVAPGIVTSVAEQAKGTVGTSLAESVKQGAKTAAGKAAGEAAVQGAESAKKQIAQSIEKKDAKSGYSLVSGMQALSDGVSGISDKMPQFQDGIRQLNDGGQTLLSKNQELNNGASKLNDGTRQLADGVSKLKDGSAELADGMAQFQEEGIEILVSRYNGDFKDLTDRIQAVLDAGESYESFGGKAEDMPGSVKFIIKTEGITADEN